MSASKIVSRPLNIHIHQLKGAKCNCITKQAVMFEMLTVNEERKRLLHGKLSQITFTRVAP